MELTRDLNVMTQIQEEKKKDIQREGQHALDHEGIALAEHKRFTFDIVDTPADPLR